MTFTRFSDTDSNDRVRESVRQGQRWVYEFAAHDESGNSVTIKAPARFQIWDGFHNLLYNLTDTTGVVLDDNLATVTLGPEITSELVPATYLFDVVAIVDEAGDPPIIVGGGWLTITPIRSVLP